MSRGVFAPSPIANPSPHSQERLQTAEQRSTLDMTEAYICTDPECGRRVRGRAGRAGTEAGGQGRRREGSMVSVHARTVTPCDAALWQVSTHTNIILKYGRVDTATHLS